MFWLVDVHHLTCYYRFCVQDGGTLLTYTIKSSEQYRVKSSDIIILTLVMYAFSRTFRRSLWAVASKLEGKMFWNPVIATMYSLKPGCYYWLVCDTWYSYLTVIRCYCYKMLRIIFRELYMNIFTGIVQEIIKANTKNPTNNIRNSNENTWHKRKYQNTSMSRLECKTNPYKIIGTPVTNRVIHVIYKIINNI